MSGALDHYAQDRVIGCPHPCSFSRHFAGAKRWRGAGRKCCRVSFFLKKGCIRAGWAPLRKTKEGEGEHLGAREFRRDIREKGWGPGHAGSHGLGGGYRSQARKGVGYLWKGAPRAASGVWEDLWAGVTPNHLSLDPSFSNLPGERWGAGPATGWHSLLVTATTRFVAMGK